ncbi:hypothetical protein Mlab_1105 [Methanocorpusculum labreanum Z]|uniref:Uncharacterized protein n=1 Tax=Methanocorpusculum labreanum (strain ATCC 43576 / DSM 4855 / Z) TaxID=410358 RepID=A2SSG8_METLZ|nr:hypothetical protein [Methanocorpusculum labreanum]ABN07274.1 hypothetical protein Mlab_1105 [Methanocorpusculum labreanum Z]
MPLSTQTKDQILALLAKVEVCSLEGSFAGSEKIIAPDITVFAPGLDHHGREGLSLGPLKFGGMEVKGEGVIAWVSGECIYCKTARRFTAVLRGTGHAWELVLLHIA